MPLLGSVWLTTKSVMASYQHVQLVRNLEGQVNAQVQMINLRRERREGLS